MSSSDLISGSRSGEIVPGDVSGGTNTSHTIIVGALAALLDAVPADAPEAAVQAGHDRGQRAR